MSEDLANMIAFLNRKVFNNESVVVYVIPADNQEWEDVPGIVLYCSSEDYYAVLVKNVHKLTITTPDGLFGLAAHEVRHRFQKKHLDTVLSEEFLIKSYILDKSISTMIKDEILDANENFEWELDALVIEEIVRNKCQGLSLEEIVQCKTKEIVSVITCNEKNILNLI